MTFDYSRLAATCSVDSPENAITLPPEAYGSDDLYAAEVGRIIKRGWIPLCRHREDLDDLRRAVQRAVRSRVASTGRLSHLERALWEFYRYLGRELGILGNRADLASAG